MDGWCPFQRAHTVPSSVLLEAFAHFITTSNEVAAVSPPHWTELCYRAQNSSVILMVTEQIIAVSAEIISYEQE